MSAKRHSKSLKMGIASKISEITLRLRINRWNDNYTSIDILLWDVRGEHDFRRRTTRVMAIDKEGLYFDSLYHFDIDKLEIDMSPSYPRRLIRDGIDFEW